MNKEQILDFIYLIKSSHPDMARIFLEGACWRFHLILRTIADAKPYYDPISCHVYSKIGNDFYDINGVLTEDIELTPIGKDTNLKMRDWHLQSWNNK